MNYYALTSNQVWDLGSQVSLTNAEHHALNQFNINHHSGCYLIVNGAELNEIVRQGSKILNGGAK